MSSRVDGFARTTYASTRECIDSRFQEARLVDAQIWGHSDSKGRFQMSKYAYSDDATETAPRALRNSRLFQKACRKWS